MPALLLIWIVCMGFSLYMITEVDHEKQVKALELQCKEKGGIVLVSKKDGDDFIDCYKGLEELK